MTLTSCENTFEPLQENDRFYFSIFGALDASSDTQWVRVMPVRESILTSPEPLDAKVTLTRKSTGEVYELEDSLFTPRNGYYAWNFWTTANIEAGEEYYFEAENSEGEISSADVFIPDDFPTPIVDYQEGDFLGQIHVNQVERLVVVDIVYYFRITSQDGVSSLYSDSYSQMDDIRPGVGDHSYTVYSYPNEDFADLNDKHVTDRTGIIHEKQEVLIVSGGPGWPETGDLTEEERFLPGAISNVENGLGILAGIVSKRVPFESCYDDNGDLVACPLLEPGTVINKNR